MKNRGSGFLDIPTVGGILSPFRIVPLQNGVVPMLGDISRSSITSCHSSTCLMLHHKAPLIHDSVSCIEDFVLPHYYC